MNLKVTCALVIFSGCLLAPAAVAQTPNVEFPAPSPVSTLKQRVGLTDISLDYSSPGVKDRKIWGGLVPYDELWRTTNRMGNVLRAHGVEPGDRVLLALEDSPEWIAAWIAAMKIGAVGAHVYTYLRAHDYAYLLDLVRPAAHIRVRLR